MNARLESSQKVHVWKLKIGSRRKLTPGNRRKLTDLILTPPPQVIVILKEIPSIVETLITSMCIDISSVVYTDQWFSCGQIPA